MFRGIHQLSLDNKGRLSVPTAYRQRLLETGDGQMVLTIDRDVQFWTEYELENAVRETNATGGTIIVMNPRNGDILAMASYPTFGPNNFIDVEDSQSVTERQMLQRDQRKI